MKLNTYQKVALSTVGATIFLIFVGSLVRASGAGLGCPDWPTCFGTWIPPTSITDLPAEYKASEFNVFKTWTEYVNRLVGVIIGLLITATFAFSFRYRKTNPPVFYSSASAFVLVLIQGWLGGQVVLTGLSEWMITIHMLLALFIMIVLIYGVFKASAEQLRIGLPKQKRGWLLAMISILLLCTFIQIVLGTQVREAVDVLKNMAVSPPRAKWISEVGIIDKVHRSFSWMMLLSGGVVLYMSRWWLKGVTKVGKLGLIIFGLILLQIATGVGLYYLGLPPVYQVVHLTGMAFLVAFEYVLLLLVLYSDEVLAEGP